MISGRFGNDDRPYVRIIVSVPTLQITAPVWFVLDTGADRTMISGHRLEEAGADLSVLNARAHDREMAGVGGRVLVYTEPALFTFVHDGGRQDLFGGDLHIVPATGALPTPSLLGRDLFDNFRITYHRSEDLLTFE